MKAVLEIWRGRSDAERARLLAIGSFVAFLLLVTLAWLPMQRERARLEAALPDLRAATAAMRRQATEVTALRAAPERSTAALQPLAGLVAGGALAQALPGAQFNALDERRLGVTANDVAWGRLLEWIANAKGQHGLDVASARIDALPMPGRVKAELVMERP